MSYIMHFRKCRRSPSAKPATSIWLALWGLTLGAIALPTANAQSYEANSQYGLQIHWSEVSASLSHTNDSDQFVRLVGDEMGYGISASYYFDPTISIRATYERATDFNTTVVTAVPDSNLLLIEDEHSTAEQFSLALVPQFDISPSLYGFAHIGVARNEFRGDSEAGKTNDTSLVYGLGFGYRLAERFTLSAEYSRAGSEYDALRVALGYRF